MAKRSLEKWKTYNNVFDEYTLRNLFRLSSQGFFENLVSAHSLGKEANIFIAEKKDGSLVIVKIYRLETCDFNQMYSLLRYDQRFLNIRKSKRQVIFAWAQREYRNLMKARKVIKVPTPMKQLDNILVMEMIGESSPAPKLKDDIPKGSDLQDFFDKTLDNLRKLVKSGIVHGDLSQFNILNYNNYPVFIDMSQSLENTGPQAKEYLTRDVNNICNFFEKQGLKTDKEKILSDLMQNL